MNTSSSLQFRPSSGSFAKILAAFNNGQPLSCDQLNYLRQYRCKMSQSLTDTLCRYYKIDNQQASLPPRSATTSMNKKQQRIAKFKEEVTTALRKNETYRIAFTLKKYQQFRALLLNELIFLHGNHTLTGAPFFAGGVPHIQLFQWGNFFGIVKYEEILGETATDANILIYFEEKSDRTVAEVIHECQVCQEIISHDAQSQHKIKRK